jgi:hypothetical protein
MAAKSKKLDVMLYQPKLASAENGGGWLSFIMALMKMKSEAEIEEKWLKKQSMKIVMGAYGS